MPASRRTDVLVIGAGVLGCSVALALSRKRLRVQVVERGRAPASGSTSSSSSIVRFNYSNHDGIAASWESKHLWDNWRDLLELRNDENVPRFRRVGMLVLDPPAPEQRRRVLELFDEVGVPYEEFGDEELIERFPALDPGRYWPPRRIDDPSFFAEAKERVSGYFSADAGFIDDPRLAADNLKSAAETSGAEFLFGASVTAIDQRGGRVGTVRLSDGSALEAPVVVNVAGPHSSRINAIAGVSEDFEVISTRPLRQEVHVVPAPRDFCDDGSGTVVLDADLGTYFRPQPGGTLLIGGIEAPCDPLVYVDDPDSFDGHVTVEAFETQTYRVARRIPELMIPSRPLGLAALYDVTPDWTPIYDRTSLDGYYVAIGTSGNQFKNAPLVGSLMARIIEESENGHDHDGDPLSFRCEVTGLSINLGHFSRLRPLTEDAPSSVLG